MADTRLRRLERAATSGGPEDVTRFGNALRDAGKFAEYYGERLYQDLCADVVSTTAGLAERGDDGHAYAPTAGGQILAPDPLGRPQGLVLTANVMEESATWDPIELKRRAHHDDGPRSNRIRIYAALAKGSSIHPLYFWRRSAWRGTRLPQFLESGPENLPHSLPTRVRDNWILVRNMNLENFITVLAEILRDLEQDIQRIHNEIETTRRMAGGLDYERVARYVSSNSMSAYPGGAAARLQCADLAPADDGLAPWNSSADGIAHAATLRLAQYLIKHHRGVLENENANYNDPYNAAGAPPAPRNTESGYLARGRLNMTSTRAPSSNRPQMLEADFDRVRGLWADRDWAGNSFPQDGEWRIIIGGPSTIQALYQPTVGWIQRHFPGARILVATEGHGYARWMAGGPPEYRPL